MFSMNQMKIGPISVRARNFHFERLKMTPHDLKQERARLGFNITGMAKMLKTPRGTYLKWERGERRIPGILEVALDWLRHKKKTGKI